MLTEFGLSDCRLFVLSYGFSSVDGGTGDDFEGVKGLEMKEEMKPD